MSTGEIVTTGRSRIASGLITAAVSADGSLVASLHFAVYRLTLFDASTLQPIGEP